MKLFPKCFERLPQQLQQPETAQDGQKAGDQPKQEDRKHADVQDTGSRIHELQDTSCKQE